MRADRAADAASSGAAADGLPSAPAEAAPFAAVVAAFVAAAADTAPATRRSRRAHAARAADAAGSPVAETVLIPAEPFELLEPAVEVTADDAAEPDLEDAAQPDPATVSAAAASDQADAFEAAARLFSFTHETPVQSAAATDGAEAGTAEPDTAEPDTRDPDATAPVPEAAHVVSRRRGAGAVKRLTAASVSVGVMGIVGVLTVGMTMPAEAVALTSSVDINASAAATSDLRAGDGDDAIQAYVAPSGIESAAIERRETYSTVTMAQLASESGIQNFSNFFVNDPNSPIQWPFAVGVPISYGFGVRSGSMHEGADFTPGEGAPIQAIADGVVRESTDSGGAFGVHIVIDHIIGGELVSSSYSHMLYGSRQVQVGDHVTVGTIVGHTGDTGRSFGAHTHFEILINGTTPIDPIPWLRTHAGG